MRQPNREKHSGEYDKVCDRVEGNSLEALWEQGKHKARPWRILQNSFFPDVGMTRGRIRICPCRVTDLSRECCKIMIVVAADIGIEPAQPEPLEQMSLPQIADIVIDPRSLGPMAHGPKVA